MLCHRVPGMQRPHSMWLVMCVMREGVEDRAERLEEREEARRRREEALLRLR